MRVELEIEIAVGTVVERRAARPFVIGAFDCDRALGLGLIERLGAEALEIDGLPYRSLQPVEFWSACEPWSEPAACIATKKMPRVKMSGFRLLKNSRAPL